MMAFNEYMNMYRINEVRKGVHESEFVTQEEALDIFTLQEGTALMIPCKTEFRNGSVRCVPKNVYENGMSAWRAIGARLLALAAQGGRELFPDAHECRVRAERLLKHIDWWHWRSQSYAYNEEKDEAFDGYEYGVAYGEILQCCTNEDKQTLAFVEDGGVYCMECQKRLDKTNEHS